MANSIYIFVEFIHLYENDYILENICTTGRYNSIFIFISLEDKSQPQTYLCYSANSDSTQLLCYFDC